MTAYYIIMALILLGMVAIPLSEFLEGKMIKKFKYKSQIPRPTGKKRKNGKKK